MTKTVTTISALSARTAEGVTADGQAWASFLTIAARFYRYSFYDQLLIYAQRPDATACALMTEWNEKAGRWVNAGSRGIALLRKDEKNLRLDYVFDVADTHEVRGARPLGIWQLREEHHAAVLERLDLKFGGLQSGGDFAGQLMGIAARAVEQSEASYLRDFKRDLAESGGALSPQTEAEFHTLLTASAQYMLLTRCGLDAAQHLAPNTFDGITQFTEPAALAHLGNASARVSAALLTEIRSTIKSLERAVSPLEKAAAIGYHHSKENAEGERNGQYDRANIQQERGLSNPEFGNRRGTIGADGQIRDAAGDLPARAPERDIHVDADDGHAGEPFAGDRPAGADAGGSDRIGAGDTKQREPSAESVGSDGMGERDEQLRPASGGDRPARAGVQLNLFSTVEEQIDRITQARAEEHSSALSFAAAFPISREIGNGVLTSGGNKRGSVLRIVSQYEKGHSDADNAVFLREEFGKGGKGLRINGAEYAAWFDADGLQIAHGRTVHVPHCIRVSWEDAAVNIRELLNAGRFAAPDTLQAAAENERRELAEKLWDLRHDSSDEAREQGFLPTVGALHNGFPDGTAQLAKMLTDPEKRGGMIDEVQAFADAFAEDRELLRFKHHMPQRLADRLADLRRTPIRFTAADDFQPSGSPYMSRDEVDAKLIGGNNVQDANYNTYSFFLQGHTPKECADFLKERYGTGGSLDGIYDSNHSSKGLDFCRRDAELPGDKIVMNWNAVAKRTDELIREGRYLTRAQLDYLPTYERYVLAHDIFFFYRDQPLAITRPFQPTKDYYAVENTIQPLLDDPARMAEIRDSMAQVLVVTAPDNRRYEGMRKTFADVTAFQNGTYSLFTPLSVEQRQTLPAKPDSLTAAARALTRKKPAAKNAESGQLTFAEDAPSTKPVPAVTESAEIAPPIDEPDLTPNVPEYLNLKVQYPAHLIGVEVGENVLFYGKDAETAAPLLGANLLTREIPGLGETFVTGGSLGWRSDLTHLLHAGHSAVFAREDCNAEAGAPYEIIKERSAADYLPIGMKLEIEGRSFEIDSIDYNVGEVSLRDITFQNGAGFPVFRSESVAFVRSFVEEQQDKPPRLEQPPATVAATRRDFRITDGQFGAGGAKAKYRMNVAAIRTLQTIEAECRLATPEEQETLSRYVGWGGASDAFDSAKEKWSAEYAELQALLTREEYDSARASVLNAHYTSPTVIKAMYEAVERMGFTTGNILEPSCGIGNFFGLLPESMAGAKLYGVELDSITGRLARQLYQSADVTVSGFEKTAFPDSFFDLAIGNIPFGDYKVSDKRYDKQNFLIHDYFFAKTLDQMRSGGVVAFITSKGTMDKQSPEVRRYLAQRADLIGAVRLPCDAFKTNAGTEVTADILFLQKRDRVPKTEPEWVNLGATADGISINNYFVQYPEMVLGTMEMQSGAFGMEATCVPIEGASLAEQLRAALMKLRAPTREFTEADELLRGEKQEKTVVPTSIPADPSVRNFSFTVAGDVLYYRENSRMKLYVTNKTREARIRGMIPIRDCTRGLIDLQMQDAPNEAIASEQARLNRLYDSFAADYGLISDSANKQALGHFDSWAAEYGEKVTAIELSPEGTGFRAKTRFAKFFNLPELMSTWKEAADIQTADMLKLPIPEAEQITVVTKPSEHQRAMVQELAKRAKDVRDRLVEPNVDNMLKITGDGRKLALDQRLQNTLLPDDMGSKVNICTGNIYDIWRDTADQKCAQLVFCDLSTPHYNGKFNVYDDLKSKLIEKGMPANEIVFIHDANTEIRKAELFAKVRSGSVRVLIGSTAKLGAGTNVQTRLIALHHLDCPWRPSDIEQREGRILRQKNENASVKIFKYVTEGTFDAYNWAIIENKQKFIGQIMTGKLPARSCEDVDATALSYAEVKALATGDPRIKQKMDLDIQVAKLKMLKAGHSGQQYETEDKVIEYFPQEIRKTEEQIVGLVADARVLLTHPQKEKDFSMTVAGAVYTERKDAGQALIALCNGMTDPDQRLAAGEYRGFPLMLFIEDRQFRVTAKQALSYTAELADDAVGNVLRIGNALESIPTRLTAQRKRLETLHAELESAKEEALRPFPKDAELTEKSALLAHLNIELDMENNKTEGDDEMTVVVLEPGKEAYTKRFRGELKDMSALVGGEIEPLYPFSDGAVLICNSRGKADGLAPNRYIEGELIAGTCFICGETEDDYTSLDRGQLDAYCKRFRLAEDFSFLAEPGKDGDYTEPVNR